jgi:hypothetical protein
MGTRPVGVGRQPVDLLLDRIDGAAERTGAPFGAPDFPPLVRLVRRPRAKLTALLAVADLGGELQEVADVVLRRAEERYIDAQLF